MKPLAPLLLFTDPNDDLAHAPLRARVHSDGHLEPHEHHPPELLRLAVQRRGLVVLAREPSPAAIRAIATLSAEARETGQLAVVLHRGTFTGSWPAHPASCVTDVPEWLWTDARAAWTSFAAEDMPHDDGAGDLRAGRLLYFAADRRIDRAATTLYRFLGDRFSAQLQKQIEAFLVPSCLDDGQQWQFPTVAASSSETQTFTQAWALVPEHSASRTLEIVDLGVSLLDDARPAPSHRLTNAQLVTARALAAVHTVHGSFNLLRKIVDLLEPRDTGEEGETPTPPSRRALLRHLLVELGHPPRWREAWQAESWRDELDGEPLPEDRIGGLRRRCGLEADDVEGRVVVVACDLEANRMLPLDEEGALRAPFAVVRYGDRLPRAEPALLVLLGRRSALARVSTGLRADCNLAMVECPLDGTASEAIPSFPDAATFLRRLAAFANTRADRVYAFDELALALVVDAATLERQRLDELEIECPPAELPEAMADLARLCQRNGNQLALVHVEVSEDLFPRQQLVDLEEALATNNRALFLVSPRADRDSAVATVWFAAPPRHRPHAGTPGRSTLDRNHQRKADGNR